MLSIAGYGAPTDADYGAGAANYTWIPWLSDKGLTEIPPRILVEGMVRPGFLGEAARKERAA
jgi:hypothetical protein